jgi:hypothetical protein
MKTKNLLESLYKNILLTEMNKKYIAMVEDIRDDLPFDNIFGDDLRIIISFSENAKYQELKDELSKMNGFISFNPVKKEVIRKVKIKTPQGEGTKDQVLNIGKAISSLKIPEEKKKKLLNWFSNYSSNIGELEKLSDYSIVLSRHPIDVLRMSDVGTIQSCHAEGGMYFHCAIQEAKSGGPIAYLVRTKDLKSLDNNKFQKDEIFEDRDRDVDGIRAITRLRIRRYTDKENNDYAIPETRIYGVGMAGFLDSVTKFLKEKQKNIIESPENVSTLFNNKKIVKRGGTYSDSSDSALFNHFFNTNTFFGSLKHHTSDEDEESEEGGQSRADQFEEELSDMKERYSYDHSYVDYNVEGGDHMEEVYYTAHGGTTLDLPEIDLTQIDFPEMRDPYDFSYYYNIATEKNNTSKWYLTGQRHSEDGQAREYADGTNYRTKNLPEDEKRHIIQISKFLQDFLKLSKIDYYEISGIYIHNKSSSSRETFDKRDQSVQIMWHFGEDESDISVNTDDFSYFCREVKRFDDKYDEIKAAFIKALYRSGLLKIDNISSGKKELTNYEQFMSEEGFEFKYFAYDETSINASKSLNMLVNDMQYNNFINNANIVPEIEKNIEELYKKFKISKAKNSSEQMTFKSFVESLNLDQPIDITISLNLRDDYNGNQWVVFYIELDPAQFTPDFVDFMIYFDQSFDSFVNVNIKAIVLKNIPDEHLSDEQKQEKEYLLKNLINN